VEGKAAQVKNVAARYESRSVGLWRQYGSNLNALIVLTLLALLPSIPSLARRSLVVVLTFVALTLLMLTWKLTLHTRIELYKSRATFIDKHADKIIAIFGLLFTEGTAYLMQKYVRGIH
jgi:hypothetical protein